MSLVAGEHEVQDHAALVHHAGQGGGHHVGLSVAPGQVRACSVITARVSGAADPGRGRGGQPDGAIQSSMTIAVASADSAGASHVAPPRRGGAASALERAQEGGAQSAGEAG